MCYTAHRCHQSVQEAPWVCRRQTGGIRGQVEERPKRKVLISGVQRSSVMKFQASVGGGEKSAGLVKTEKKIIFRLLYFHWSTLTYQHSRVACEWSCVWQVPGKFQGGRQKAHGGRGDTTGLYRKAT